LQFLLTEQALRFFLRLQQAIAICIVFVLIHVTTLRRPLKRGRTDIEVPMTDVFMTRPWVMSR
jgi:hypothetical protein